MKTMIRLMLALSLIFATSAVAQQRPYKYLRLSDSHAADILAKRALIERYGGRIIHEFPPNEFICEIDTAQYRYLYDRYAMDTIGTGPASTPRLSSGITIAQYCFQRLISPPSPPDHLSSQTADTLPFGCGTGIQKEQQSTKKRSGSQALAVSRLKMFNANYLVGKTAVCVVIPEGPTGTRDWALNEDMEAVFEVVEAYDQLSRDASTHFNVDVTWVYELHLKVPVSEEPIHHFRLVDSDDFGWIAEVNLYLGVAPEWEGLFDNANRMRQQYATDWGITYYVVKNEPGEYWNNGTVAGYTVPYQPPLTNDQFRAPFAISVFDVGDDQSLTDEWIAHETLHIFGTPDEYGGATSCSEPDDCSEAYGFLYVENGNCAICEGGTMCIMKNPTLGYDYCDYTLGHIGWSDSDDDGHPDAIDLNNDKWTFFEDVQPGDLITVTTIPGDVVRNISVTESKTDVSSLATSIYFDCANYQSQSIAFTSFYVSVNGGPPSTWGPALTNSSVIPNVHAISFDDQSGNLSWDIANSLCYIELEILRLGAQAGDTVLLAKPAWNRFYQTSTYTEPKTLDVSDIFCDPCIARFWAWRPDGNANADMVQYVYSNPYSCCGLYTEGMTGNTNCDMEGKRNLADITRLTDHVYGSKAPLCCHNNGNTDGSLSGDINLADITRLIDHVYYSKEETEPCL